MTATQCHAHPPGAARKPALEAAWLTSGGSMTAPHPAGFNGARDAAILAEGDFYGCHGLSVIQATARTKPLLHRAGFPRVRMHAFYEVPVMTDEYGRLQLAPREHFTA